MFCSSPYEFWACLFTKIKVLSMKIFKSKFFLLFYYHLFKIKINQENLGESIYCLFVFCLMKPVFERSFRLRPLSFSSLICIAFTYLVRKEMKMGDECGRDVFSKAYFISKS